MATHIKKKKGEKLICYTKNAVSVVGNKCRNVKQTSVFGMLKDTQETVFSNELYYLHADTYTVYNINVPQSLSQCTLNCIQRSVQCEIHEIEILIRIRRLPIDNCRDFKMLVWRMFCVYTLTMKCHNCLSTTNK